MGASVVFYCVVAAGPTILLLVIITVVSTIIIAEFLSYFVFSIHEETGSLLAIGSGICGVSAVVATSESIHADDTRIAYAAAASKNDAKRWKIVIWRSYEPADAEYILRTTRHVRFRIEYNMIRFMKPWILSSNT
ncbi:putative sulfate exporter family transporter [Haladaptatus halobius]|uniref:putative sulfate exporter family transporter n=1 Tax=Haladaptatus halobius TaxID=2884875 RepID=UPI001D0A0BA9|nr:putative sulfate exporter family transporter [Haladaptatus halobius]